ncbi:type I-E CRISPR-associated protein Cas7/Cse4/CasC [Saccharomonospora glauca]|uniref:CRISPR-associated protein Cas7/Cse4/CasC, subtype I n=1 Tax=Saccharomonospora glauca K62 TaxID=928724 RepID=I1D1R6_9PSEU|nr:type I-E CRISPR-associated protein Cas7/Cse4/CasC [Saccharomonospora glauca]EIE98890.1 CRISPR-associated protein Cas7/Cse4/CasC, subtype I [Saccharomonospora glauca K62]
MSTPKYIDIHVIQTLPFSNVNRDDTGSPKTVEFGGVERTRVSSQSWKRVVRQHVEEAVGGETVRTRRVVVGVAERLIKQGWEKPEAEAAGVQIALSAGKKISLKQEKDESDEVVLTTNVLLLLPESGIDELAALADEHREMILAEAKKAKKLTGMKPKLPSERINEILSRRSATINLFGRMVAELPGANVDGAVQVAHAFTTHGTAVEYDFFTAVDDIEQKLDLPGSGYMDTALFSAGTFYRYANVNLTDLLRNLDRDTDLARVLVKTFLDGFITTVPSGKQNATAAVTLPDLVYVTVRDDRPVSLANAFEAPVGGGDGFVRKSAHRLDSHAGAIAELLGESHVLFSAHTTTPGAMPKNTEGWSHLGVNARSFEKLIDDAVDVALPGGRS